MLFSYPSCFSICQVYGSSPKSMFTELDLGGLLLLSLKALILIRNGPSGMQRCVSCKDVSEAMIHWVICYSFYQNHEQKTLWIFSKVVEFTVGQKLHFCLRDTVKFLSWLIFLFLLVPKKLKANIMTNILEEIGMFDIHFKYSPPHFPACIFSLLFIFLNYLWDMKRYNSYLFF